MTKEQTKQEFNRWVDADYPLIWARNSDEPKWGLYGAPFDWTYYDYCIIDDKHIELRKLQINEPDIKFEYYNIVAEMWLNATIPNWDINTEYRIKPKEWYEDPDMVGKPIWVKDRNENKWVIDVFRNYQPDEYHPYIGYNCTWKYAKPVDYDDLYKG